MIGLICVSLLFNWQFFSLVSRHWYDDPEQPKRTRRQFTPEALPTNLTIPVNLERVNGIVVKELRNIHQSIPTPTPKPTPKKQGRVKPRAIDPESLYPKKSLVEDFPTHAAEEEVKKHDRLIVQGMKFINSLNENIWNDWIPTQEDIEQRKLCMNIYTTSRDIPYIDALIMSLMKGQTPKRLVQYAKVNLMYMERRPGRVDDQHIAKRIAALPFLEFFNYSDTDPNLPGRYKLGHRQHFMFDTIRGLENCVASGLPWCLMIEEDGLPPLGFIDKLDKFVIQPLTGREKQVSVVSLFSYFNLKWSGPRRLSREYYSRMKYNKDRAMTNPERRVRNLPPYVANFTLIESNYSAGTVAMLYTNESASQLAEFLKAQGYYPKQDADILINHPDHFPSLMNAPRLQLEPSLVNHIGFYSSHSRRAETRAMLDQLNTDVRFMFDEGPYEKP